MATFSNTPRNTSVFTNNSRNSSTFANSAKSDSTTFGNLTDAQIGTLSNDSIFQGKAVGLYTNDDVVSTTIFTNALRS